ncbi:type IV secretory system conjugative DNA transfer family protein [Pseudactinotalea sp. HY158]|uniref:type IV secretory system conjugative DNA transfer family protein n=1 Tax=Pseudactinotalea sp. HY158 TaxID=2654547 RepID=UPI00189244FA|nr:type IV secretion system DNA-binding domain-containing protein [Pseudactinotalea sp. HY158]
MLGPRLRPRQVRDVDVQQRALVTRKLGEHGFGCAVRLSASAGDLPAAESLVRSIGAALSGLTAPGVRVGLVATSTHSVARAASPWFWPLWLSVSDLVPLLAWPTAPLPLLGVPSPHPRPLPAGSYPARGTVLGRSTEDGGRPLALSPKDRLRHLHVLGPSGVGKSTLLANLALGDIAAGHGVIVIDPKGDLVGDIATRVPPDRQRDVVILDPGSEAVVGLNALDDPADADRMADVLLGVFHDLYADAWGPRTHDILHACLLSLARRGDASLAMVPLLLTNPGFQRSVTGRVAAADPMGLGSFWAWYEAISEGERQQAIAPLMNKLRQVLLRPGLRAIVGQRHPKFRLRQVFAERKILLVNLAKGTLGGEAARLLGCLAVALVWQEILGRSRDPATARRPVFVHIDEAQDYLALGDLGEALAQARGLGVGFTLAHQHLGQFTPALRAAVVANAQSRVTFRLSPEDAAVLARTLPRGELATEDYRALPAYQAYLHGLVNGQLAAPASLRTMPLPVARRGLDTALEASAARWGTSLDAVERDLLELSGISPAEAGDAPRERPGRVRPGGSS